MRPPIVIEDPDQRERRLREDDEQRVLDQDERWQDEDPAGLRPWGTRAHRMALRACDEQDASSRKPC